MVLIPAKRRIARTFGLKASTYNANAHFQANCINRLLPLIEPVVTKSGRWIDLGCGTGLLLDHSRPATEAGRIGHYFGLDIAFEPLRFLKNKEGSNANVIQGDIDKLPLKPETFEGAVASSVLQWIADPAPVFAHIAEILVNGGYCAFSLFIKGSFFELFNIRASFKMPLPIYCPDPDSLKGLFQKTGLNLIHSEIVEEKHYFPDAMSLLKKISGMGGAITADRKLTRQELNGFCRRYEDTFRKSKGVPLTYRAMIGICRKMV